MISLVPTISEAPQQGAALLIECRGSTPDELQRSIFEVNTCLYSQSTFFDRTGLWHFIFALLDHFSVCYTTAF